MITSPMTTQPTMGSKISPLIAFPSPLPDIHFTPLEELEDEPFMLEEPIKRMHKKSRSFQDLPCLQASPSLTPRG
jgi:hypothetical protein